MGGLAYDMWKPLTKMVNSLLSSFIIKNLMRIIRELDKEFPIYSYTIYTTSMWFILIINSSSSTIMSIYCL